MGYVIYSVDCFDDNDGPLSDIAEGPYPTVEAAMAAVPEAAGEWRVSVPPVVLTLDAPDPVPDDDPGVPNEEDPEFYRDYTIENPLLEAVEINVGRSCRSFVIAHEPSK